MGNLPNNDAYLHPTRKRRTLSENDAEFHEKLFHIEKKNKKQINPIVAYVLPPQAKTSVIKTSIPRPTKIDT